MADSLRDQLLKSGIVQQTRKTRPPLDKKGGKKRGKRRGNAAKPGASQVGEADLARAWSMRAQAEAGERRRTREKAEAEARARKERLQRLRKVLDGKALNKSDADRVRHFEYGGKIRRVYVDAAQLAALNQGSLGVVQLKGSYVLVAPEVIEEVKTFAANHVALLVDPTADADDDGVPDDLIW
ncbi:MAG TPA: DUF2058 family protein [Oleiagrimonas sp.]|nr:DUF2058 family protein [Oleiagrimonas sp.]